MRDALAKTAKRSRQGRRNRVSTKTSNALTAKRFERKVKDPLKAGGVLSAKQRISRRLAPPREARSGTSRRQSDFVSQHKGPQHPVGVGDRTRAFRAALDLIHSLHANQHLADDGILAVEEGPVFKHDEELGIGRVW